MFLRLFWQVARRAASRTLWTAVRSKPSRKAKTANTTSSSTRVKPRLCPGPEGMALLLSQGRPVRPCSKEVPSVLPFNLRGWEGGSRKNYPARPGLAFRARGVARPERSEGRGAQPSGLSPSSFSLFRAGGGEEGGRRKRRRKK